MTQSIQNLVKELISYTCIKDSSVAFQTKGCWMEMAKEFKRLEASNDANKQVKMIALFMGATIAGIVVDDDKYMRVIRFYPRDITKNLKEGMTLVERFYALGNAALANLPEAFNGEIFKRKGLLLHSKTEAPFYPKLSENAAKVDELVDFCMTHAQDLNYGAEVEATNITTKPVSTIDLSWQILGGFMAVVGCAAVATAFLLLNAATFGVAGLVVAGLGVASALAGVGLFAVGTYKNNQVLNADDFVDVSDLVTYVP